jgi:cell division protein FtsB
VVGTVPDLALSRRLAIQYVTQIALVLLLTPEQACMRTQPSTAASRRHRRVRRIIHYGLLLFSVMVAVDALVGDDGLIAMLRARRQHDELAANIQRQRVENDRLREEIRLLTEDPATIEDIARRELGLIRPGEKVFILKDLPPARP